MFSSFFPFVNPYHVEGVNQATPDPLEVLRVFPSIARSQADRSVNAGGDLRRISCHCRMSRITVWSIGLGGRIWTSYPTSWSGTTTEEDISVFQSQQARNHSHLRMDGTKGNHLVPFLNCFCDRRDVGSLERQEDPGSFSGERGVSGRRPRKAPSKPIRYPRVGE